MSRGHAVGTSCAGTSCAQTRSGGTARRIKSDTIMNRGQIMNQFLFLRPLSRNMARPPPLIPHLVFSEQDLTDARSRGFTWAEPAANPEQLSLARVARGRSF